jgi:gliding motility-associated-like protein
MTTDNTSNKIYTFTPDANQCANSTTMTINFDAKVTPTFMQVDAILAGDYLEELPTTSLEGILGTWSPAIDNTNTTAYTFIPDSGQCVSTTLTTMTIIVSPNIMCTQLIFPKNGQIDLPINTHLKWGRIQGATGYFINIGTQSGSTDIENYTDIGNSNMYSNITWKPNTTYYITIIAYNNFGEAIDCNETSFSTTFKIPSFFTPNGDGKNDYWIIEDDQKSIKSILIFNRFGKLISTILPSFSKWDGTYNGKLLEENDYWYLILLNNGNQLKGSITLKR